MTCSSLASKHSVVIIIIHIVIHIIIIAFRTDRSFWPIPRQLLLSLFLSLIVLQSACPCLACHCAPSYGWLYRKFCILCIYNVHAAQRLRENIVKRLVAKQQALHYYIQLAGEQVISSSTLYIECQFPKPPPPPPTCNTCNAALPCNVQSNKKC